MIEKKIVLKSKVGLHARPAALFVKTSGKFTSEIRVTKQGKHADAKSLLSLISLGAVQNDEITIRTEGADEKLAMDELINLVTQEDFQ